LKKYFLHIILSICSFSGFSQDIQGTLTFADSLFATQNYEYAIKNYKRVLFFGDDKLNEIIQPKLANCFLLLDDYEKALFHYNLAYSYTSNDSLSNEYLFKRVLIYIIQNKPYSALQELYNISVDSSAIQFKRREFFHAVIDFQNNQFESAENHFLYAQNDTIKANQIIALFDQYNLNKPKTKTARILSMFIPGAGQLYAGDVKNAANSLILTSGLTLLFIVTTKNYSLLDAFISVLPWINRYYVGGFTSAGHIAAQKIEEKKQKLYHEILLLF